MVVLEVAQDAPAVVTGELHECPRRVARTSRHRETVEGEAVGDGEADGRDQAREDQSVGVLQEGEVGGDN